MWDFRRKGWTFRSGGEAPNAPSGSGLFRTADGGRTWTELTRRRPTRACRQKPLGRIALAVAPSNAKIVYALIESHRLRAVSIRRRRQTWEAGDKSQWMVWRPFYFASLIVDPKRPDRLFKPDCA